MLEAGNVPLRPTRPYDPADWYWQAEDGRVFSSARMEVVDADDEAFAAFLAAGGFATQWPRDEEGEQTDAALHQVLAPHGLWVDLVAYTADRRWQIETGGIEVGGAVVATDRDSQGMIGRAYSLALVDPDEPVDYKAASGWIEIDSATLIAIATAVGRHVRACFRAERQICDQIETGQITTSAEIDAAFAAAFPS